jgi:hypothetical protein
VVLFTELMVRHTVGQCHAVLCCTRHLVLSARSCGVRNGLIDEATTAELKDNWASAFLFSPCFRLNAA